MIERRGESVDDSRVRRDRLRLEYERILRRTKAVLSARQDTRLLTLRYEEVLHDPSAAAGQIALFTGTELDLVQMANTVDPLLHRNRG